MYLEPYLIDELASTWSSERRNHQWWTLTLHTYQLLLHAVCPNNNKQTLINTLDWSTSIGWYFKNAILLLIMRTHRRRGNQWRARPSSSVAHRRCHWRDNPFGDVHGGHGGGRYPCPALLLERRRWWREEPSAACLCSRTVLTPPNSPPGSPYCQQLCQSSWTVK